MTLEEISLILGIPQIEPNYYGKPVHCEVAQETENFLLVIWHQGVNGAGGDWTIVRIFAVHKATRTGCELTRLDQTWGGTWYELTTVTDHASYLDVLVNAYCKSSYGEVVWHPMELHVAFVHPTAGLLRAVKALAITPSLVEALRSVRSAQAVFVANQNPELRQAILSKSFLLAQSLEELQVMPYLSRERGDTAPECQEVYRLAQERAQQLGLDWQQV